MRKFLGGLYSTLALGSAMFFTMFAVDLVTGGNPDTTPSVLAGLVIFFGGLAISSGYGAWRMLTTKGARARAPDAVAPPSGIDIALEARVLALAAKSNGRVTIAEVAVACAVPLEQAEKALDELAQRGHANMHITDDGQRVYVLEGFLSDAQKQEAQDIVEVTRG